MIFKFKKFIILLIAAVFMIAGCGENQEQVDNSTTYTIADATGDWGFPSPYAHYQRGPGYIRMSMIFDTLVWKDEDGYVPALAKDWSYNEEENSYEFVLRDDVKWHDGEEFSADDVVFTFEYTEEHPYAWVDSSKVKRVTAENNNKVKVYLEENYAPFMSYIAGTLPILPEHIYKDVENPREFIDEKALVGTGPFKFADYSKEHGSYLYHSNEDYYNGSPAVDKLKFVKLNEEMSVSALRKGDVNAAEVPPEMVNELEDSNLQVLKSPYQWNAKLTFNHKKQPFSEQKFRQALGYAINREEIVDIALRGKGEVASTGMIPSNSYWCNQELEDYKYSSEKTVKLLNELNYKNSGEKITKENGEPLTIELLTSERFNREAEIIKEQLAEIGIKVDVRSMEAKTIDTRLSNWKFDMALTGHGGLGGDPEILNKMILGDSFNSARYTENDKLVVLLNEHLTEMDREKRRQIVCDIQEIYSEELPALSIYYPDWFWGHDGNVSLYYTLEGVASGVPIPLNKMCFVD